MKRKSVRKESRDRKAAGNASLIVGIVLSVLALENLLIQDTMKKPRRQIMKARLGI